MINRDQFQPSTLRKNNIFPLSLADILFLKWKGLVKLPPANWEKSVLSNYIAHSFLSKLRGILRCIGKLR